MHPTDQPAAEHASSALPAFPRIGSWDAARFKSPGAIFRGAPFWSWNGRLDADRLIRQLEVFQAMHIGGAHLHARTGLATPYLGDEFLALVRRMVEEARRRNMLIWLYDEDRWPSGFAGGLVTKDPAFRCRHLRITRRRCEEGESRPFPIHHGPPQPVRQRRLEAAWAARFDGRLLLSWRRLAASEAPAAGETGLWAYVEVAPDWSWFNHAQYANLLDPKAVARFIESTHESYARAVGGDFGRTVPAIFTDEPLLRNMERGDDDEADLFLAWADDLPQTYQARFNEDLLERLPAVLFDAADGSSPAARWRFRDHHTDRFVDAFARQIADWCEKHGIALTGHLMAEQSLCSQSDWVGEVMRNLRYFQLPGIDLLCDGIEYSTAKQAQSVARQCGRPGVMSELYGVTNWDFPFAGHIRQGNWQAALGVTVRVHHLSWYSMAGEAKRDYPASIGWHVPWWPEYAAVEDHFARVAVALQTGRPICRVGLLHPIESRWVVDGPTAPHAEERALLETGFQNALAWLLEGHIDADLVAESLLTELAPISRDGRLRVGAMAYEAIVIPPLLTIRSSTLDRLDAFVESGGTVILLGDPPALVHGEPSRRAVESSARWRRCVANPTALQAALRPWREVDVWRGGRRADGVVHQLREEPDGGRILFLCRTDKANDLGLADVRIRGRWLVESLDTATGNAEPAPATWDELGWTHTPADLPVAGHALLRLRPPAGNAAPPPPRPALRWSERFRLDEPVSVTLSEPNVLLLDCAAWRVNGGAWQVEEEVLRADNLARSALGLPRRHGDIAQPWAEPPTPSTHKATLRFEIRCDAAISAPRLAMERADEASVQLDGRPVPVDLDGYYVDEDIPTATLPDLPVGGHVLEITWPFGPSDGLEACYLLGDFGVAVAGRRARLAAAVRELAFGDWTVQGLPFYGGNVAYHCRMMRPDGRIVVCSARTGEGRLQVIEAQRAGRKRLPAAELLRGWPALAGMRLGGPPPATG